MIVSTNEQAAVLAERARNALLDTGAVHDGPTVQLRDNVASVGDHIVTRRNNRQLRTSPDGWVVNGDVWTITDVRKDGSASVRRHRDDATITLPADYLVEDAHLAYATTAHRVQGTTVDVCHASVVVDASHEALYVAASRGRDANHMWVIVDSDPDLVRDSGDLPAPEQILSRILERCDPDRLSAHQVIEDSQTGMVSLARVGAIFEDAARTATDQWLRQTLTARGLDAATTDAGWPSLVTRIRQAALAGHDLTTVIDEATRMRSVDDAHSTAAVLHWRVGVLTDGTPPGRGTAPLASLPPAEGPAMEVARQAGELMRQRWRHLRQTLAGTTDPLWWAPALGAQPSKPADVRAWLTAATAVAAYRERYELPDHAPMLGPRPADSRPDAQAAWDHARLQADRYLARRLRHLDDKELADLSARQRAIIYRPPFFDPTQLEKARQALDEADRTSRTARAATRPQATLLREQALLRVDALERRAEHYRRWRDEAEEAASINHQIQLERWSRARTRQLAEEPALIRLIVRR